MEKTEPTFVPEWLKSSVALNTSHQSSSLHTDEQGVSKPLRNKSLDTEFSRNSTSDRTTTTTTTTSSYFRRSSISNGSALSRSYSSFGRNNRDRDNNRDNNNRQKDYSDRFLGNILPSRFEKEGLRRSFSSVSGKRGGDTSSFPRKVASDISISNKSIHNQNNTKTLFERDFPSLGTDEKGDNEIGRVPSPGLSSAIQSLPVGNVAVIGGDGWTSALAEVPVIVGSNGSTSGVLTPVQTPLTASVTGGRNMAETLAHGPPRTQIAPQVNVGTQRLEELAVKQSRQLIPMTPSMPKALALNSDKPKLKVNQSQLVNHPHPHSPRPISTKPDMSKTQPLGKLQVLKPSRERNGTSTLSPTKLPNSPLAPPTIPSKPTTTAVPLVEKRPSSQAQSRNNFFNLMRKKSMTSSGGEKTGGHVAAAAPAAPPPAELTLVKESSNGDVAVVGPADNGRSHDVFIPEEEEARFLRSLGWDETAQEEEGLTEEEISSFYKNYLSLKPASKFLKGTEPKLLMGSDSKVDA